MIREKRELKRFLLNVTSMLIVTYLKLAPFPDPKYEDRQACVKIMPDLPFHNCKFNFTSPHHLAFARLILRDHELMTVGCIH